MTEINEYTTTAFSSTAEKRDQISAWAKQQNVNSPPTLSLNSSLSSPALKSKLSCLICSNQGVFLCQHSPSNRLPPLVCCIHQDFFLSRHLYCLPAVLNPQKYSASQTHIGHIIYTPQHSAKSLCFYCLHRKLPEPWRANHAIAYSELMCVRISYWTQRTSIPPGSHKFSMWGTILTEQVPKIRTQMEMATHFDKHSTCKWLFSWVLGAESSEEDNPISKESQVALWHPTPRSWWRDHFAAIECATIKERPVPIINYNRKERLLPKQTARNQI